MSTKPFSITRPGKYLRRDGSIVTLRALRSGEEWYDGGFRWTPVDLPTSYAVYPDGRISRCDTSVYDIIAHATQPKAKVKS